MKINLNDVGLYILNVVCATGSATISALKAAVSYYDVTDVICDLYRLGIASMKRRLFSLAGCFYFFDLVDVRMNLICKK